MIGTLNINPISEMNDQCLTSKVTCQNLLGDQNIKLCLITNMMMAATMVSVSVSDCKANIDDNVSTAFSVSPSVEQCSSTSSDVAFCKAINMRGEISKLSSSIGSCNVSSEFCSLFDIDKHSFSKWEEVESTLKSVLNLK